MTKIIYSIAFLLTTINVYSQQIKYVKEIVFVCTDTTQTNCRLSRESFYKDSELQREKSYKESGETEEIIIYENINGKPIRKIKFNGDSTIMSESILTYDNKGNHLRTTNYIIKNGEKKLTGENIYSYDNNNFLISNEAISYSANFRSLVTFKNDKFGNYLETKWIIKQGRLPGTSPELEKHKYEYNNDNKVIRDIQTGVTFGKDKFEFTTETIYDSNRNKILVKNFKKNGQLNYERRYVYNSDNLIEKFFELDTDGLVKTSKLYKYIY